VDDEDESAGRSIEEEIRGGGNSAQRASKDA
jgi:hypothetical protein